MITLALAGKPNCGKSTFFKAATMAHAEIANYPFTTINPNFGVAYVRTPCACTSLKVKCRHCVDGNRFVAVNMIDVAGLVPDAHKGKGLGNQFLDHLRQANAILHIIDASGGTDSEGNPVGVGSHDPVEDVKFLGYEMTMWVYGILDKHWAKLNRQAQVKGFSIHQAISETFTGLGITSDDVRDAELRLRLELVHAKMEDLVPFCAEIVKISKPMLIVGNKFDEAPEALRAKLAEQKVAFASAASELALRNAAAAHMIGYLPGDPEFRILNEGSLSSAQKAGLVKIADVMKQCNGTGVQQAINRAVFELLDMIVVYPVEDENHYCNKQGDVLPDAFLMKNGSTPHDLAFQVHTDIGKGFLYAVDARTKMRIKENHVLKNGDIIKIVSAAR
ncbi:MULTISPECIES: redox-regulated ATPase YchF [unclassified Methanoregula]|uniref:redox-regulated ATPase YchF n=1 Tax=unclassified Methanoregula TaxID=2649730 RepID=UPI0009CC5E69|nr:MULTISPECIES: redox-regulated ATPase YchF [unclassified Methanoregula]OPX63671.1 MAG: translation-associated GTPase [Methanoregula sp. PtaB.Bin085]OPY36162.1 MAG: translation-associated GTPase [Methanoregula sp. PtaU1.Bin006]